MKGREGEGREHLVINQSPRTESLVPIRIQLRGESEDERRHVRRRRARGRRGVTDTRWRWEPTLFRLQLPFHANLDVRWRMREEESCEGRVAKGKERSVEGGPSTSARGRRVCSHIPICLTTRACNCGEQLGEEEPARMSPKSIRCERAAWRSPSAHACCRKAKVT